MTPGPGLPESRRGRAETATDPPGLGNKPRVLCVEDDQDLAVLIQAVLAREGLEPVHARDGREAVAYIENNPPVAGVLLDILLPYLDGFQLIQKIRAQPGWQRVPILMLSAKVQQRDVLRALEAGANDYMLKPFDPAMLVTRLRRLLGTTP